MLYTVLVHFYLNYFSYFNLFHAHIRKLFHMQLQRVPEMSANCILQVLEVYNYEFHKQQSFFHMRQSAAIRTVTQWLILPLLITEFSI
jgi:hypothetical protein